MSTWLAIGLAFAKLLAAVMQYARTQQDVNLGRSQAVAEALTIATAQLQLAAQARAEAAGAHAAHPNDDGGFDQSFERKD